MSTYNLNIIFDPETLEMIKKMREKVVINKFVDNTTTQSVAWLVFNPYVTNAISWAEDYSK